MKSKEVDQSESPGKGSSFTQVWKSSKFTISVYWQFMGWKLILFFVVRILRELENFIYAVIFAKALDQLIEIATEESAVVEDLYPYIAVLFAYLVASSLIDTLYRYLRRSVGISRRGSLEELLIKKYNELGLMKLEDPEISNQIKRSQDWLYMTSDMLFEIVSLVGYIITLLITGFSVFIYSPYIALLILLVAVIQFVPTRIYTKKNFSWWYDNTEKRRKSWDDYRSTTRPEKLKEVFVTGGGDFFTKRFMNFHKYFNDGELGLLKQSISIETVIKQFENVVVVFGYFLAFRDALLNLITLGDVTLYMRTLNIFNGSIRNIFFSISYLLDLSSRVSESVEIFEFEPMVDGTYATPRLVDPPEILIKDVWFKYPRSKRYIFKDLNLHIKSGEKIAIVGHNGAGKTTLVNLLARLYDNQKGEILINGRNIKDLKINDWYKNMGILFQEYNFYPQLTVEENIFAGKPVKKPNRKRAIQSAKLADAHNFIMEYENQYKEVMSQSYDHGTRPSTGQAQKIALARFFYRDAPLAIFDEPTAAIDAVSEYKIFNEIYDFFEGKTVIIISHRFSTVRNADRIIVMDKGKIVEEGSHDELMKQNGRYAEAFNLQAEGYQK